MGIRLILNIAIALISTVVLISVLRRLPKDHLISSAKDMFGLFGKVALYGGSVYAGILLAQVFQPSMDTIVPLAFGGLIFAACPPAAIALVILKILT